MTLNSVKKNAIKANVFYALLTALNDIMGQDGKNSILRYAGLEEYITIYRTDNHEENETIPYSTFHSLLNSMYTLLGFGTSAILHEAGRKWLIYLSPFGLSLNKMIKKLEDWIGGKWELHIKDDIEFVRVYDSPICYNFESITKKPFCFIICGIICRIKESETGEQFDVKEDKCITIGDKYCQFRITKKNKLNVKNYMKE